MATSAGSVTLDLDANSIKLMRELKKSQRATERTAKRMQQKMTRAFKAISASVLSAGSALAAFSAFRGFSRIIGEIDKIGKLVDRLGGSTEAFSELQFVAERSGLAFNTLTMGMQRMSRRVAEAASGFGEAKAALAELGLNAEALNRLPLDKQLETIADALLRVKVDADKTRLAMKLFEFEGVALLQMMKSGSAGIRELREEAKRLGLSLSREQVDAATKAQDAITDLDASFTALARTLVTKVAPALTAFMNGLQFTLVQDRAREIAVAMDTIRKDLDFYSHDPEMVNLLLDRFAALAKELENLKNPAGAFSTELDELQEIFVTTGKKTDVYGQMLDKLNKKYKTAEQRIASLRSQLKFYGDDLSAEAIAGIKQEIIDIATSGIEEIDISSLPKKIKPALKEMSEYAKQAARNMQDAFAQFLFDPFEDGVRGMLKSFLDAIRRMIAEQAAARFFESSGIGNFIGNLGKLAAGGPVTAGTPYLVGERGPELFMPNIGGNIIPNGAMGGSTTIYNIEAGADVATIMSMVIPALERTKDAAVSEVITRKREGKL